MSRIASAWIMAALLAGCATPQPTPTPSPPDKPSALTITVPPPNGRPADVKGVSELIDTFMAVCLNVFPDDGAVAAKASADGYVPLSPQQVRQFLHDDPGRGWLLHRGDITLAVTVE